MEIRRKANELEKNDPRMRFVGTADDLIIGDSKKPEKASEQKEQKMRKPSELTTDELAELARMLKPLLEKAQPDEMKGCGDYEKKEMDDEEDMSMELEIEKETPEEEDMSEDDMEDDEDAKGMKPKKA